MRYQVGLLVTMLWACGGSSGGDSPDAAAIDATPIVVDAPAGDDAAGSDDAATPDAPTGGDDAATPDASGADARPMIDARLPDTMIDARLPDTMIDARLPDTMIDARLPPDARQGPCTIDMQSQTCIDCLLDAVQTCNPQTCNDEGAALVTCGLFRGCCTSATMCNPTCLQTSCPTQWNAVIDCAVGECGDEISVCY